MHKFELALFTGAPIAVFVLAFEGHWKIAAVLAGAVPVYVGAQYLLAFLMTNPKVVDYLTRPAAHVKTAPESKPNDEKVS